MTRAIFCNRSVNVAYDDFVLPSILSLLLHSVWLFLAVVLYIQLPSSFLLLTANNNNTDDGTSCTTTVPPTVVFGTSGVVIYCTMLISLCCIAIIIDGTIAYYSSRITRPLVDFSLWGWTYKQQQQPSSSSPLSLSPLSFSSSSRESKQQLVEQKQRLYVSYERYIYTLQYLVVFRITFINVLSLGFACVGAATLSLFPCVWSTSLGTLQSIVSVLYLFQIACYPGLIVILIICGSPLSFLTSTNSSTPGNSSSNSIDNNNDDNNNKDKLIDDLLQVSSERWSRRCRRFSCCCRGIQEADHTFSTIGNVLAGVFEDLTLTRLSTSDILTALALVRVQQKDKERQALQAIQNELVYRSTHTVNNTNPTTTTDHHVSISVGGHGESSNIVRSPLHKLSSSSSASSSSSSSTSLTNEQIATSSSVASSFLGLSFRSTIKTAVSEATRIQNYSIDQSGTFPLDPKQNTIDYQRLQESARYSSFALGNYGVLLYTYMNTCHTCYRLPYEGIKQCINHVRYNNYNDEKDRTTPPTNNGTSSTPIKYYRKAYYDTYLQQYYPDNVHPKYCSTFCNCNDISLRSALTKAIRKGYASEVTVLRETIPTISSSSSSPSPILYTDQEPVPIIVRSNHPHAVAVPSSTPASLRQSPMQPFFHTSRILHNSYINLFFTVPWYICIDTAYRNPIVRNPSSSSLPLPSTQGALVVSARGSLSLEDLITDGLAVPFCLNDDPDGKCILSLLQQYLMDRIDQYPHLTKEKIEQLCDPRKSFVHAGIWKAATAIRKKLFRYNLLLTAQTNNATLVENYRTFMKGEQVNTESIPSASDVLSKTSGFSSSLLFGPSILPAPQHQRSIQSTNENTDGRSSIDTTTMARTNAPVPSEITNPLSSANHPPSIDSGTLQLILCGHSLGSGVASLLALQLFCFYPTLRCYAYSSPGAVVSTNLAYLMESFVTSIVLGKDMVGRLSLPALRNLSNHMVESLVRSKQPKYKIFCSCWYGDTQWPGSVCCIHGCRVLPYSSPYLLITKDTSLSGGTEKNNVTVTENILRRQQLSLPHPSSDKNKLSFSSVSTATAVVQEWGNNTSNVASYTLDSASTGMDKYVTDSSSPAPVLSSSGINFPPPPPSSSSSSSPSTVPPNTTSSSTYTLDRRQLFALPMHIPGTILHLVRYRKISTDWITWLCIRCWSLNFLWSYGQTLGDILSNLFCGCCRRTKSQYVPRYAPSIRYRYPSEIGFFDDDDEVNTKGTTPPTSTYTTTTTLLSLDELLISPYMLSDHMPDKVERVLSEIVEEFI